MDKRKLADLSREELKELYKNNDGFQRAVWERAYEVSMFWQSEDFDNIGCKAFDYHDHYSSFYLTTPMHYGVRDGLSVAGKLDRDYLNDEAQALYDKLCEYKKLDDSMTLDELEEWEEKNECDFGEMTDDICDQLADNITKMLREYEDISDGQIDDILDQITYDDDYMGEWMTDGTTVYETIVREYK